MTTSPLDTIRDTKDLRHVADYLGSKFFSAGAMRFFNSRILEAVYPTGPLSGYFVTSERNDMAGWPRAYTVRSYSVENYTRDKDGRACQRVDIETVGDEQGQYATAHAAKNAARVAMVENKIS